MSIDQIAAEAAKGIWQNRPKWTIQDVHLIEAGIKSAIEKAINLHDHDLICASAKRTNESRAAQASDDAAMQSCQR